MRHVHPDRRAATALTASLGVRPQLVLLGPLVPWLATDFGTDHATLGFVATSALLATALGATATGRIVRRRGPADAVTLAMSILLLAIVIRAVAPSIPWLVGGSILGGLAIGIVSSALPAWMSSVALPAALGSTSYTIGMIGGSILAGLVAAPLAEMIGGWRGAIAALGLLTLASAVAWLRRPKDVAPVAGGIARASDAAGGSMGTTAILIALAFGLQAAVYQGIAQWGPDLLGEEGWPATSAGAVVGLVNLVALLANLGAFAAGPRLGGARRQAAIAALTIAVGTILIAVGGLVVPGIIVVALGLGLIFPAAFAVVLEIADDPADASTIAGRMNALGFAIAAVAPLGLGITRDWTGSYAVPLFELVGLAAMLVATTLALLRQPPRAEGPLGPSGGVMPSTRSASDQALDL